MNGNTGRPLSWTGAEAYERFMGRWSRVLAVPFLDFAGVAKGDHVLEIGCGTGSVTRVLLGTGARVTAVEPSDSFASFARQRFAGESVHIEIADALDLPFAEDSFDRCVSMLVLTFVTDLERAVEEMRRVVKAGGRIAAAVWDYGEGMEMLSTFWKAVEEADPSAHFVSERQTNLSPDRLEALFLSTGLQAVETASLTVPLRFESFDDFWTPFLLGIGPAGRYVSELSGRRLAELREILSARVLGERKDGPFEMRARAWAVRGAVPV